MRRSILIAILAVMILPDAPAQWSVQARDSITMLSRQDHQRMMDLLNITSLRPGVDGMNPSAPNAANYDEAKANPYPNLPDPLILNNGRKVKTPNTWWKKRRPEIVEYFDREVYGRVPENTPQVKWKVISVKADTIGGIFAVTKKLRGHADNSSYRLVTVDIELTLTTPADASDQVPVIMELGFVFPPGFRMPVPVSDEPRWKEQVLRRGWGFAILVPVSVQPDHGAGLQQGIIGLTNKGQGRQPDEWGALRAWAWGASRAMDYFETDPSVDAARVGIEGHSRYGKAALVAMAYDPRFAIGFISSSGAGGAKLYRRNAGEIIENLAGDGEYHWMAGNFIKYAGPLTWDDLPVDSHELIALCAPRPIFISSGDKGDGWVDARGMFMAGVAASPVYSLLGKKTMGTDVFPPLGAPLTDGEIAFRQHNGGHTPEPNWPTFLDYSSRYFNMTLSK